MKGEILNSAVMYFIQQQNSDNLLEKGKRGSVQ